MQGKMKLFYSLLVFSALCIPLTGQEGVPWKYSEPELQGVSSLYLEKGIEKLRRENTRIHSLLVIRNDRIILDAYFYPFQKGLDHDMASVTKSITALLVGLAIDKGFIKDEYQPVIGFFPEYVTANDTLLKLTIKDLLNMASGFRCSWFNGEKELSGMNSSSDWVKYMFGLPFSAEPGTRFSYCSGNFYLLAEIIQRATKMSCHEFADRYLFKPLGTGKTFWEKNRWGVNHGWGDLFMSPYDLARIGSLLLNEGKWNGVQVISKNWIDKIQPLFKIQKTESYGYGWWLDSENPDEIQAVGRGGQRLFVFRECKMIIVATGGGFEAGEMDNLVLDAIRAYDKNSRHGSGLDSLQMAISKKPDTTIPAADFLPDSILNKEFVLTTNRLNITTLKFEKQNDSPCRSLIFPTVPRMFTRLELTVGTL